MTPRLATEPHSRGSPADIPPSVPLSPEHAASVRRHPSSTLVVRTPCPDCGFRPPARAELADAVEKVPDPWAPRLDHAPTPADLDAAAQVRDELHVVANRIERLLASPGATVLASATIDAPTAQSRAVSAPHLRTLLGLAADRLAAVVRSVRPDDWQLRGRIGSRQVGVEDLVATALHRSHARLLEGKPCR